MGEWRGSYDDVGVAVAGAQALDPRTRAGLGLPGNVRECFWRGISQLATAGYAADTLIIDAAGAEQLDLLRSSGSEKFWTFGAGNFAPGQIFGLNRRVTKADGTAVADSQAFGRLYASPLQLQRFEVDAGLTNRSNYRLEGHATFGVERVTAGVRII
jgi:hypothetical protein